MTAPESTSAPADVRKLAEEVTRGFLVGGEVPSFVRELEAFAASAIKADRAARSDQGAAEAVEAGWRPIETAPRDGTHALFFWPSIPESASHMGGCAKMHHGVSIGWFEWDEDFKDRPKGWASPECGFRMEGDQCLARNQEDCRYWQPLPDTSLASLSPREATPDRPEIALDAAIERYNAVWQSWPTIDASNVDECRRAAMAAALYTPARPEADDEGVRREVMEERIREDERDRLYEKARRHAGRVSVYATGAFEWLRAETDAMLPADRALLRKGGAA